MALPTVKRDVDGVTEEEKCGAVTASDLNTEIVLSWQIILLDLLDHSLSERTVLSSSSSYSLHITSRVLGFFLGYYTSCHLQLLEVEGRAVQLLRRHSSSFEVLPIKVPGKNIQAVCWYPEDQLTSEVKGLEVSQKENCSGSMQLGLTGVL